MLRIVILLFGLFFPTFAFAQSGSYCETDANGNVTCTSDNRGSMLEASCASTAQVQYCLPYHQLNCQRGFQLACQMAALGQHCQGGNAQQCQYYMAILQANTACNVNGRQDACSWLYAQGFR